jgi:hypothetical protein
MDIALRWGRFNLDSVNEFVDSVGGLCVKLATLCHEELHDLHSLGG